MLEHDLFREPGIAAWLALYQAPVIVIGILLDSCLRGATSPNEARNEHIEKRAARSA
jgi:hypothetical protein